jgi:hypothetical protein
VANCFAYSRSIIKKRKILLASLVIGHVSFQYREFYYFLNVHHLYNSNELIYPNLTFAQIQQRSNCPVCIVYQNRFIFFSTLHNFN